LAPAAPQRRGRRLRTSKPQPGTRGLLLAACTAAPDPPLQPVARVLPATDCRAWVGTDRYAELPRYRGDYYVDEFADAKLKSAGRRATIAVTTDRPLPAVAKV
jgi:hypothetical protein